MKIFFFKQKTAYERRISDWSSDVCSSDLGNITVVGEDGRLLAFDTGPGNALIDDWMQAGAGRAHDMDGAVAAQGEIRDDVLCDKLVLTWFEFVTPTSPDRHAFWRSPGPGHPFAEGQANLTEFLV